QSKLALIHIGARDIEKITRRDICVGREKMRRVRNVVRFCAELQVNSFVEGESAEQTDVGIEDRRGTQDVPARSAKPYGGDWRKGVGIVVRVSCSNSAEQ